MNTRPESKNLEVKDNFEDRGVDGGTISYECKRNDMRTSACEELLVAAMKLAFL
jgi:hypothetical protein